MSKKRKKKSPLRNEFTDALNVEMAERKIVERTQKEPTDKKQETVESAAVEVAAVSLDKISVEKVAVEKVAVEKVSVEVPKVEEIAAPQIVEVKTDPKLEKRILKEADSTFLDEKPPEKDSPKVKPHKSIFRSKTMRRWEAEQFGEELSSQKVETPKFEKPIVKKPKKMSHPEKFGGIISVIMLVYAAVNLDKPLFFLSMALFVNFLRQPLSAVFGKYEDDVSNALHSFSIVLFFGAILFVFTN